MDGQFQQRLAQLDAKEKELAVSKMWESKVRPGSPCTRHTL
jgi:hypothetical protein